MKEKFVPYEKLSKKEQKKLNSKKRKTWGALDPVARVVASRRTYSRKGRRKGCDQYAS